MKTVLSILFILLIAGSVLVIVSDKGDSGRKIAWLLIITVLPVIGITLPFYSAGGTSVLMMYICVGLILSVYMHNKKTLFGNE